MERGRPLLCSLSSADSRSSIALLGVSRSTIRFAVRSAVLFGLAFPRSKRAGQREPAGPKASGKSTPLIWQTLHAFWHVLAAGGTAALFHALLYPDIASGTCP